MAKSAPGTAMTLRRVSRKRFQPSDFTGDHPSFHCRRPADSPDILAVVHVGRNFRLYGRGAAMVQKATTNGGDQLVHGQ